MRDQFGRIDLDALAFRLGVEVVAEGPLRGVDGYLTRDTTSTRRQPSLFEPSQVAHITASGTRMHFTVAHELAHVLIDQLPSAESTEALSHDEVERLADRIAAELVLPLSVVAACADEIWRDGLSLEWISDSARRLGVSLTALVARLSELVRSEQRILDSGVVVAMEGVSARQRLDYAPRLVASCLPVRFFLPHNKRLVSVGARRLDDLCRSAPPFDIISGEESLLMWNRALRTQEALIAEFRCQVLLAGAQRARLLVATLRL